MLCCVKWNSSCSPWCLCERSGYRADIWAPPGSAACRSQWWARCFSVDPTLTSAGRRDSLSMRGKSSTSINTLALTWDQQHSDDRCSTECQRGHAFLQVSCFQQENVRILVSILPFPECNDILLCISSWLDCISPPGTCSMKIFMKPFSLIDPRYWTMFLCFRCLWSAISSCSGWEYLC